MSISVATVLTDKPQQAEQTKPSEPVGFGAYGTTANPPHDLTMALDKPPESKTNGSMDFTDADKRWLKDLGITTTDPNSFHKAWQTEAEKYNQAHRKWADSTKGRVAMRVVSRGVVGALFYAAGNMYAGKAMKGYNLHGDPKGALQHIARFVDNTFGKTVQAGASVITQDENKAFNSVIFRDTVDYGYKHGDQPVFGRSLGHEAMMVTFDFASMSFGDYMTRYALGLVDPNATHHWMKNGHLDVPGGLKDLLKNVIRGITYASGEDIAVAIPYVFGTRFQRNLIEKSRPGFKHDADLGRNGGSFEVHDGKIVGDYQPEGMLDLVSRFSWYNVGTKMFRDAYANVQRKIEDFQERWKKGDHSMPRITIDPQKLTPKAVGIAAAHGLRYVIRTTLKVMGYMIPATGAFIITRSPQSKVRGLAIDPSKGVLGRDQIDTARAVESQDSNFMGSDFEEVKPGSNYHGHLKFNELYYRNSAGTRTDFGKITESTYPFDRTREQVFDNSLYQKAGTTPPWYQKGVNAVARANYNVGTAIEKLISAEGRIDSTTGKFFSSPRSREKFARIYTNAAISYTPYFMMKTDILAAEWDTKRMDMAIDRTLDGIGHLKWNEVKAGGGEVLRALMREPFSDPQREKIAQRERWSADPEHRSNEAFQLNGYNHHLTEKGAAAGGNKFADEALKAKPITPATLTKLKTPDSWAAQEAVRKFQDQDTQGQSVH